MDRLWSPWRHKYIESFSDEKNEECFLCAAINSVGEDAERLIVKRDDRCIVLLNKYPYNSGHTLVVPLRHIAIFEELTSEELTSIMTTTQNIVAAMKKAYNPHGFNIGINVGQSAGAGLPGHLHFHIVPRWNGDANFATILADTRIISRDLEDTRVQLMNLLT